MKYAFLVGSLLCVVVGLSSQAQGHTDVSVADANGMIVSNPELIVMDVRSNGEYCGGHIAGALNYVWDWVTLDPAYATIPLDADILVVCASGGRSNAAANFLDGQGYLNVYDMLGGTSAWIAAGYPTVGCVDSDGDGRNDDLDNCPGAYNPSQQDSDGDGIGNACCPNLDGIGPIGMGDLIVLSEQWLLEGPGLTADLDDSESVDLYDLEILGVYWGSDCSE